MDVHRFCIACLSTDRLLHDNGEAYICDTYTQIIQEISQYNAELISIKLCFECCARVKNYYKFKSQAKTSYIQLYNYIHQGLYPHPIKSFHLKIKNELKASFHPNESIDEVIFLNTESRQNILKDEKIDIEIDEIKEENSSICDNFDSHYSEPETFTEPITNPEIQKTKKKHLKNKKHKKKDKRVSVDIESEDELNLKQLKEKRNKECLVEVNNDTTYDCTKCEVKCDTKKQLMLHNKIHKKPSKNTCDICLIKCKNKSELVKHMETHSLVSDVTQSESQNPAPTETEYKTECHTCELCREKFKSPDKFQLHMIRVHKQRPECKECGKFFSSRKTYRYHIKVIHKGYNRFPCPQCGKVYQWKSNLWRHLKNHKARDNNELYCSPCDRKFSSVATYQTHLRLSKSHVSETAYSYMCSECGKKFVNKTRLKDHVNWDHLNTINYRCPKCNKPFKSSTSLYVHLHNVHKNKEEKDNLCHVCGKSYQNIAKLKYHIVAMHTNAQPYSCSVCHATFSWYSSLYRHTRDLHQKVKVKKMKKEKKESECPE